MISRVSMCKTMDYVPAGTERQREGTDWVPGRTEDVATGMEERPGGHSRIGARTLGNRAPVTSRRVRTSTSGAATSPPRAATPRSAPPRPLHGRPRPRVAALDPRRRLHGDPRRRRARRSLELRARPDQTSAASTTHSPPVVDCSTNSPTAPRSSTPPWAITPAPPTFTARPSNSSRTRIASTTTTASTTTERSSKSTSGSLAYAEPLRVHPAATQRAR